LGRFNRCCGCHGNRLRGVDVNKVEHLEQVVEACNAGYSHPLFAKLKAELDRDRVKRRLKDAFRRKPKGSIPKVREAWDD